MVKKKARKSKSRGMNKGGIFGVTIALIIVLVAVYVGYRLDPGVDTPTGEVTSDVTAEVVTVDPDAVLATVNGGVITQARIDARYAELPASVQAYVTKESLLEEVIDEVLLNSRADELNIVVTAEELEAEIDRIGEEQSLTREEMDQILLSQGSSLEAFRNDLSSQIRLQKLFDEEVKVPEPSEEEIQEAYEKVNPVLVKHILIAQEESEAVEELYARAEQVLSEVAEDRSNFCELVTMNTVDTASIANCGEYEVFKGSNFVPEFEQAALEMEIDELRIVESQFGYHIIWKVERVPLEKVRDGIVQTLQVGISRELISDYLAQLRESADITYGEPELGEAIPVTGAVVEEIEVVLPETVELQEPEVAEVIEEPETVVVVEEEPQETEKPKAEEYVSIDEVIDESDSCFGDVKLYGAHWDSQTKKQLTIFEKKPSFYVECFEPNSFRAKKEVCSEVEAFPTWDIDGEMILGYLSSSSLKSLTGC